MCDCTTDFNAALETARRKVNGRKPLGDLNLCATAARAAERGEMREPAKVVPMRKRRKGPKPNRLEQCVVDRLLAVFGRHGMFKCVGDMAPFDPYATKAALQTRWNLLRRRGAEHSWSIGHHRIWLRLDKIYSSTAAGARDARGSVVTPPPDNDARDECYPPVAERGRKGSGSGSCTALDAERENPFADMAEQAKLFASKMEDMAERFASADKATQQPAAPGGATVNKQKLPSLEEFIGMPDGMRRMVLRSGHQQIACEWSKSGFMQEDANAFKEAWGCTYCEYDRKFGTDLRGQAQQEGISQLDVLQSGGMMVRFYELFLGYWGK